MHSQSTSRRRDRHADATPLTDAAIVGIPFDLGAPRRGASLAPRAVRFAGLIKRLEAHGVSLHDLGDVSVPDTPVAHSDRLRNFPAVLAMAQAGFEAAREAVTRAQVGVFLGGDHSVAIGTIAGTAAALADRGERLGLIWFDAHGDFNTAQTTLSGQMHGMPFATSLGFGAPELTELGGFFPKVRPEHAVLIGARDVDSDEQALMATAGLRVFPMAEVMRRGIDEVMAEAIALVTRDTQGLYLSFDVDAIDPDEVPGTGTPVRHGLTVRESLTAIRLIAETGFLRAMDVVEIDPLLDLRNQSAMVGVDLIEAAFS